MISQRKRRSISEFKPGDRAMLSLPFLTVGSANQWDDIFTVTDSPKSPSNGMAVENNRTGHSYVFANCEYCFESDVLGR